MPKEIVGVILAGGRSRRMGTDKAFLEIGGIPLIERGLNVLQPFFQTVAIVAKDLEKFCHLKGVRLIPDLFPEQHAAGGISTALKTFSGKDCFVFACDLPFLHAPLIQVMMQQRNGYDLVIPRSRHGLEPLHAIYTTKCLNIVQEQILQKRWHLAELLQKVCYGILTPDILHTFDPGELCFMNVNAPAELRKAQEVERVHVSRRVS